MSENSREHAPWGAGGQDAPAPQATQPPLSPYTQAPLQQSPGAYLSAPPFGNDQAPPLQVPPPGWRPGYRAETHELDYHRLALADPKNRWWSPLVEAAIGVPIYFVLSLLMSIPLVLQAISSAESPMDAGEMTSTMETLQRSALESPLSFTLMFGSIALMFPVMWLARLIIGPKPWGLVHSVAGRIRWDWLLTCCGIATLLFVVFPVALDLATGGNLTFEPKTQGSTLAVLLLLVVLIVPFQAYAEELVFRGYLLQTVGRWLKHPAWAIVLPAPLFMLGHAYDLWAQLSILVMALAAGFVTWRTGGLEAAIALHVVNNLVAMTFGIYGLADPFVLEGSTWVNLVSAVITQGLFVLVVLWAAKKRKLARTRTAQVWVKDEVTGAR